MTEEGLNFLIDRAGKSRDSAGVSLAKSRQTEQQISQQIRDLEAYKVEYRERLQKAMSTGSPLHVIQDYQAFLASLERTIEDAQGFLEKQQKHVQASLETMQGLQKELSSFTTLANRQKETQQKAAERKEARQHDAVANQMYLRKLASGEPHGLAPEKTHD